MNYILFVSLFVVLIEAIVIILLTRKISNKDIKNIDRNEFYNKLSEECCNKALEALDRTRKYYKITKNDKTILINLLFYYITLNDIDYVEYYSLTNIKFKDMCDTLYDCIKTNNKDCLPPQMIISYLLNLICKNNK